MRADALILRHIRNTEYVDPHDERLRERGISLVALSRALANEPIEGRTPDTLCYREKGGGVSAIVNTTTGRIITVWWT